jgi:predicted metal-binding membrane protein
VIERTPVLRGASNPALAGLLFVATLAWAALIGAMLTPLGPLMMPPDAAWRLANAAAVFLMWALMMAAMMLPSAVPMAATFASINRRRKWPGGSGGIEATTCLSAFVGAYLLVWTAFSVVATGAHWGLQAADLLSPAGSSTSRILAGALLLAAGVFQLTPLKRVCLHRCRTPLGFLMTEWRDGASGAFIMGVRHGVFCVGCCWAMMALLFVFGVMSLPWVALLATAVAAEKIVPWGDRLSRWVGIGLIAAGAGLLTAEAIGMASASTLVRH